MEDRADRSDTEATRMVAARGDDRDTETDTEALPAEEIVAPARLAAGARVGRYVVVDFIGKGGMGEVYRAYDPELGRAVAVKLLTAGAGNEPGSPAATRLLREAQALAQLSHPNVVTVYDVGPYGHGVFMAMELVVGRTLREYLDAGPHPRADVLAVLRDAGRGLAAAHRAGMVHRDFKPRNVLLGDDGRVRVIDFGVVRATSAAETPGADPTPDIDLEVESQLHPMSTPLTRAGVVVGTLAYMSPEQADAREVDDKSDQYAFGVVLFEALYGKRPFRARTRRGLITAMEAGALQRPAGADVPAWLDRIATRALAARPAERYPSMDALLDDLARDPAIARRRARVRLAIAAAVVAFVATAAVAVWGLTRSTPRAVAACPARDEALARVWDAEARSRLRARFVATGRPGAADTAARVARALDGYAEAWDAARRDACEATRVRATQSAELMDLRNQCLDRQLGGLRAFVDLLAAHADGAVVDHAVEAVANLPSPEACAGPRVLAERLAPPDARAAPAVAALRDVFARASALALAGNFRDALAVARVLRGQARIVGYVPLEAEVVERLSSWAESASSYPEAAEAGLDAAALALEVGAERTAAQAYVDLLYVLGTDLQRYDEAFAYGRIAAATLAHLGDDGNGPSAIEHDVGLVEWSRGDYAKALAHLQRAYDLSVAANGADSLKTASVLNDLGLDYTDLGQYDRARDAYQRALDLELAQLGPDHPDLASTYLNLGNTHYYADDNDHARQEWERAVALWERTLGPDEPRIATALGNLGSVYRAAGDHPRARAAYTRALEIREKALGPDSPRLVYALSGLGKECLEMDKPADAIPYLERALALCAGDRCSGEVSEAVADARCYLAHALWESGGDRGRARALARDAVATLAASASPRARQSGDECQAWLAAR